jgi:hypothetical protein
MVIVVKEPRIPFHCFVGAREQVGWNSWIQPAGKTHIAIPKVKTSISMVSGCLD